MWHAEKPSKGPVDQKYPKRIPTYFTMSPQDLTTLLGEPNSKYDWDKTTHAWDVTDGTNWVHVCTYKRTCSFSMRGDEPDATSSFLEFIKRKSTYVTGDEWKTPPSAQRTLEDDIFTGGERETPLRLKRAREDNESDQSALVRKRLAVVAAQTKWAEVDKEKAVVEKKKAILQEPSLTP